MALYVVTRAWAGAPSLEVKAGVATVTVLLVAWHLRLMDDLKDADEDALWHPDRPLPSGLVSTVELCGLLLAVIAVELTVNLAQGAPALAAYGLVLGYTLLMFREFFVGYWLRCHRTLYALLHQASLPLLAVYVIVVARS